MSNVFIIGGAGNIGRYLCQYLARHGHVARPLHRRPEQAETLRALGAEPVQGDLLHLDVNALTTLIQGSDAVVFTAGAGGKGGEAMTNAIDGEGLEKAVKAAQRAGVQRFLLVSAFPEAARGKALSETFETYMRVKKAADVTLAASTLAWVIVRPGTLTDDPGSGQVQAGLAIPYGNIPREDVAKFLAALIDQPAVNRVIIELTAGTTPIAHAVAAFA
ncbi:SDR family oxidoreductase [Pantoea sp. Mb-10]|uniref:NAD(P)-binding oxidoreductase n=1 Tax=unclassified Pantoea TaxID=2630326 RepID=UPI001E5465D7|nr:MULTISPECIES: NAD(P)H-binding protein [unclassified Pantoea]MCE0491034.1 SDR family oxidoreductase [Pantoea sp. Mb-10]MCE0502523.1 SDR family oxidoreductase [Pantoea sp. Pb-8]